MGQQINIFNQQTSGAKHKKIGLQMAVDHADSKSQKWSDRAWSKFKEWLDGKSYEDRFMIEDFREWAETNGLDRPPSLRAYGFLPQKAVKAGIIRWVEYKKVKNYKAHEANASLWAKNQIS